MADRKDEQLDAGLREAYTATRAGEEGPRRLLERLRAEPRPRRGMAARFMTPAWSLSPALAAAWLIVLLGAGALVGARIARRAPEPAAPTPTTMATATGVPVTFVLRAPGATRVTVAGDFNGWDAEATPLARANSGDTWTVRLTVPPGVHYYSFVLDRTDWRPDPAAPLAPAAVFGTRNSVLVAGEGRRL